MKRGFKILMAIIFTALMLFSFCACNAAKPIEQNLFVMLVEATATPDSQEGTLRIGFTSNENAENKLNDVAVKLVKTREYSFLFYRTKYVYTTDTLKLVSAARNLILNSDAYSQEVKNVKDQNLKVLFRYVTIYKSVETNGSSFEQNKNFVHTWTFSPDDNFYIEMTQRAEFRAVWYALLIGAAILALLVSVPLTIIRSRKKFDKTENEKDILIEKQNK